MNIDVTELLNNHYFVKALHSIALAVIVYLLAKLAISIATKGGKASSEAHFAIKYSALCFFGISLIFIWLEGIGPVLTALTIVAAALTIVAKELILNFLGSFVIFWRELFAIGDRVQLGDFTGDVIDKGLFYFTLLEVGQKESTGHSTGRLVKVPNAMAVTNPVVNATRGAGYLWNEVRFAITRQSDWEKARATLFKIVDMYYRGESIDLNRVKHIFEKRNIFFRKLTPRAYMSISTGGLCITLRYLCRARMTRESQDFIITNFLLEMKTIGVELADEQP
ncbi:mechanosensitive ion channel family protein [Pseudodesulfovibrio piezophilus]|uniref:MscS Mechanosensitive ion channel n=1 Tax=Pseudodesulfovibrio piezophilus (strain DSM 21447 / JCM 15486 / C1TLV30) TaxID=1322246 RepID=M1WN11_PSEP2|nr:mechanosensitive ion channel domain-containing protein [Pseudodesulfovibrio piezophilus]CCH50100.1 MscS Mechanosensitive ion channel [Pseudodesulfovibrio piezophilus C1TLV30]